MGGCVIGTGKRHIVIKTKITKATLDKVAAALSIKEKSVRDLVKDEGEFIHVYAGNRASSGGK
jgi:hypothetical protein